MGGEGSRRSGLRREATELSRRQFGKGENAKELKTMDGTDKEQNTELKELKLFKAENKETEGKHKNQFHCTYHISEPGLTKAVLETSFKSLGCWLLKTCSRFRY